MTFTAAHLNVGVIVVVTVVLGIVSLFPHMAFGPHQDLFEDTSALNQFNEMTFAPHTCRQSAA